MQQEKYISYEKIFVALFGHWADRKVTANKYFS
jgi:hypothetical protein